MSADSYKQMKRKREKENKRAYFPLPMQFLVSLVYEDQNINVCAKNCQPVQMPPRTYDNSLHLKLREYPT